MPTVHNGDYEITYGSFGDRSLPTMLLVNGFTSQMINYATDFCEGLVEAGFHVARYDNRDVGLSTKTSGSPPEQGAQPSYTLSDMAGDGMAVLDDLGVERAHVAGMSMGGMIVQRMAIEHGDRVASMTSIMSTTGDRSVGQATSEAMSALTTPPPSDRDGYISYRIDTGRIISGPLFDAERAGELAGANFDRCFHPAGALFQMAAIMAAPDRTEELGRLDTPSLVIHGRVDPLIQVDGGEATAAALRHAELKIYDDMGHDLPAALYDSYANDLTGVAKRSDLPVR